MGLMGPMGPMGPMVPRHVGPMGSMGPMGRMGPMGPGGHRPAWILAGGWRPGGRGLACSGRPSRVVEASTGSQRGPSGVLSSAIAQR